MDHLNSELSTLVTLARMEQPTAAEKARLFELVLQAIERRESASRSANAACNGGRGTFRVALLMSAALSLSLALFGLARSAGPEPQVGRSSAHALAAATRSTDAPATGQAAAGELPAAPRAAPTKALHGAFAHQGPARAGSARRRVGGHSRAPARLPIAVTPPAVAVAVTEPQLQSSVVEPELEPEQSQPSTSRFSATPARLVPPSPDSAQARAAALRKQLIAEAEARYRGALGERAHVASVRRPLSSVAWY